MGRYDIMIALIGTMIYGILIALKMVLQKEYNETGDYGPSIFGIKVLIHLMAPLYVFVVLKLIITAMI